MENQIDKLISRGFIKISDDISFKTKAECASLFGRNYSHIIRGGVSHPKEEKSQLIFWQERENEGWENGYTADGGKEIIKFTERRKSRNSEWVTERTGLLNKRKENIIFYKIKGEGYKFRGIFHIDEEETISSGIIVYKRISSEASTYLPLNKKPIKDLRGLVSSGRLKENEEIYLSYRGEEYAGRVTADGKIRTPLGEFSPSKAAVMVMSSNPSNERNKENANGYHQWKTWNDIPIGDLRKI
jgi:hypothetical protein